MKKFNTTKLLFALLGIATFTSLAGTVSGTLAWYAYSTRAALSYTGTSIEKTAQLQIGIVSPVAVGYTAADKVTEDQDLSDATHHYYFAPVGTGLTSAVLNKYLIANGYASTSLVPATSGTYARGDAFSLKTAPNPDQGIIDNSVAAPNEHFAYFQFVFRIAKNTSGSPVYADGQELWLTDAEAHASYANGGNVSSALRIYVDRGANYENNFIFHPTANAVGSTKVGGLLDLDGDGYYDYNNAGEETLYGQYTSSTGLSNDGYDLSEGIVDVNGSGASAANTFTAAHAPSIKYYSSLSGCGIKTASYESISSIAPKTSNGKLENFDEEHPTSICKTDANDNHLARVNMTVYLEGWDFSVVDEELHHMFDVGLTFEINKVIE